MTSKIDALSTEGMISVCIPVITWMITATGIGYTDRAGRYEQSVKEISDDVSKTQHLH